MRNCKRQQQLGNPLDVKNLNSRKSTFLPFCFSLSLPHHQLSNGSFKIYYVLEHAQSALGCFVVVVFLSVNSQSFSCISEKSSYYKEILVLGVSGPALPLS